MQTPITSSSTTLSASLTPNTNITVPDADAKHLSSTRPGDAVPSRALRMACGGGAPGAHIEFTSETNPATIARDLAAAAKKLGGPVREFTVYAVFGDQPVDGALVSGNGMKGGPSLPLHRLVASVMSSGALQRGGTLALGNIYESNLTPGLLSGLAKKHGITIAIKVSGGAGINLYRPDGTVTADPSREIGQLDQRGGCGPGLQPRGV